MLLPGITMPGIISLLILFIFFGCKQVSHKTSEYRATVDTFPNGQIKSEFVYSEIKNDSCYTIYEYHSNGKISFKGTVENRKFIGAKLNYYANGNLREVDSIINPCALNFCCCDGKVFKYYLNGKLNETYENRNGIANGLVTIYDSDSSGIIVRTVQYKDDKKNGQEIEYHKTGEIYSKASYRNDTAIGYIYYFKANGDTSKYFYHLNGEKNFPAKKWLENGQIFYATYTDSSHKKAQLRWTDKTGKELKKIISPTEHGKLVLPD